MNKLKSNSTTHNTIANKVQLVVYAQKIEPYTLYGLQRLLNGYLQGLFHGVHILPFYETVTGFNEGFDPIDHLEVDPELGTWLDIKILSNSMTLVVDMILNHISAESSEFQDVVIHGDESASFPLFLTYEKIFPRGAKESDLSKIYRSRPGLPFSLREIGKKKLRRMFWTTFTQKQIDIDVRSNLGQEYQKELISNYTTFGVQLVRLGEIGYIIKKSGTSCFLTEDTKQYMTDLRSKLNAHNIKTLVEVHTHYKKQIEISQHSDFVYDYCLPPLVLYGFYFGDFLPLHNWLKIAPRNCITVLDTHDGIGILDVARDGREKGLLNSTQIRKLIESIHKKTEGESVRASGKNAKNLDIYQINTTLYSALACDDTYFLLARLLQFFCPGIPHVYYAGFFAVKNDMKQLNKTNVGRDINRPILSEKEIKKHLSRPVVKTLSSLIRFRNSHKSFQGEFSCEIDEKRTGIELTWKNEDQHSSFKIFKADAHEALKFSLSFTESRGSILTYETMAELEKITK